MELGIPRPLRIRKGHALEGKREMASDPVQIARHEGETHRFRARTASDVPPSPATFHLRIGAAIVRWKDIGCRESITLAFRRAR
jgi:hypothetical protein